MLYPRITFRYPLFIIITVILSTLSCTVPSSSFSIRPAHSHNDYLQSRPLQAALNQGFTSIEIDIFPRPEGIYVAHTSQEIEPNSTLESLYLQPLARWVQSPEAKSYKRHDQTIQLLIDIKKRENDVLNRLEQIGEKYDDMFTNKLERGDWKPFQIVLSGDNGKEVILNNPMKYAHLFIDGRVEDLGEDISSTEVPLISMSYWGNYKYRGEGEPDKEELYRIKDLIREVHSENKKIRFWATANNPKMWKYLLDLEVDYVNVDSIAAFSRYYDSRISAD